MTTLRKNKEYVVHLGTPGTPGTRGVPATRGHWETRTTTTTTYHTTTESGERLEIPNDNPNYGTAEAGQGSDASSAVQGTSQITLTTPGRTNVRKEDVTTTERVWVPGTKAVPAVPAKPGTPTTIKWLYNEGWNNGYAVSVKPVGENEGVEFQVPAHDRGVFVGLADRSRYGQSVASYAVGVMADASGIWVHERGRNLWRLADNIDTSWIVRIQRNGERVTYQLYAPDGTIVSAYASAATLPADANIHAFGYLYRGDDEIRDAAIVSEGTSVLIGGGGGAGGGWNGGTGTGSGSGGGVGVGMGVGVGTGTGTGVIGGGTGGGEGYIIVGKTGAYLHGSGDLTAFPLPIDRPAGAESASWMRAKATMTLRPTGTRMKARGRLSYNVGANRWGRMNGKLPALAAKLADKKFGEIGSNLPGMTGRMDATYIPPRRQTIDLYLMGIAFSGLLSKSKAGRIDGTLPRSAAKLSHTKAFGAIDASLPPVLGYMERDPMPGMGWLFAGATAGDSLAGTREQTAFLDTRALLGDEYRSESVEGVTGTGDVTIPALTVAGRGQYIGAAGGAGAVNLPPLVVKGRAAYLAPIKGVGAIKLSPLKVEAKARYAPSIHGFGAVNLPPLSVRGSGRNASLVVGAGDVTLSPVEVHGKGVYQKLPAGCELTHCGMTGRALIRRFRELSQDEVEPYLWEDCFLLNMLNEAEREAADRAKLLYDDSLAVAVTVKAGKARYAIDPHIIDIERAALTADGDRRPLLLKLFDRLELDWRTPPRSKHEAGLPWGRPFGLVFDGKHEVEIVPGPRRDGRLLLGVHRLPWADFDMDAEPEIPCVHHASLVDWALFRAFSIPDADEANDQLATFYPNRFEQYFGRRIDARKRRLQRANKPHTNKLW